MMNSEQVVLVRFLGSSTGSYAYLVPSYLTVEKGDLVVVEARDTYGLGKIFATSGISRADFHKATKYVVDVVDIRRLDDYRDGWEPEPELED